MRILVDRAILEDRPRIAVVGQHVHRLLDAAPEEINLQIERPAVHVLVEVADIGVVALLEVALGVVTLRKDLGKRRLAAPDVSGYGYVHSGIGFYIFNRFLASDPCMPAASGVVYRSDPPRLKAGIQGRCKATALGLNSTLPFPKAVS